MQGPTMADRQPSTARQDTSSTTDFSPASSSLPCSLDALDPVSSSLSMGGGGMGGNAYEGGKEGGREGGGTRRGPEAMTITVDSEDLNPLKPCGACMEWLKKIAEKNPEFRVATFTDEKCRGIYTEFVSTTST